MTDSSPPAPLTLPAEIPPLALYDSRVRDYCDMMKAGYYDYLEASQWLRKHPLVLPRHLSDSHFRLEYQKHMRCKDHAGYTTVVFAGLTLEAAANSTGCHFFGGDYQRIDHLDVPTKWEYLLAALYGHQLDRSKAVYGDLVKQQKARNALVHSKAKRLDRESAPTAMSQAARGAASDRVEASFRAVARLSFAVRHFPACDQVAWNYLLPSFETKRDPWLKSEIPESIRADVCGQLGQLRANIGKCV